MVEPCGLGVGEGIAQRPRGEEDIGVHDEEEFALRPLGPLEEGEEGAVEAEGESPEEHRPPSLPASRRVGWSFQFSESISLDRCLCRNHGVRLSRSIYEVFSFGTGGSGMV